MREFYLYETYDDSAGYQPQIGVVIKEPESPGIYKYIIWKKPDGGRWTIETTSYSRTLTFDADEDTAYTVRVQKQVAKFVSGRTINVITPFDDAATGVIQIQGESGLTISPYLLDISAQGWQSTLTFSPIDYRQVQWGSGSIILTDGTTYSIDAGNTSTMSALTYIYLDINTSITVLQITTTAADAVGTGKILIGVAENNADTTSKARYQIFGGEGGETLFVDNIAANSASTNEFVSNTAQIKDVIITNAKINDLNVNKLAAGTIASKIITLGITAGVGDCYIGAGKTDFTNAQTGLILGLDDSDGDKPKFYIGNATKYLNWTGSALEMTGAVIRTATSGGRIEMLYPDSGVGLWVYNSGGDKVFRVDVAGTDAGDVWLGDFDNDKGCHWDNSATIFTVRGLLTADDIVAGGTITGNTFQTASSNQRVIIDGPNNKIDLVEAAGTNVVLRIDDDFPGVSTSPGMLIDSSTGAFLRLSKEGAVGVAVPTQQVLITHNAISIKNNDAGTAVIFATRDNSLDAVIGAEYKLDANLNDAILFQGQSGSTPTSKFEVRGSGLVLAHYLQLLDDDPAIVAYTGAAYKALEFDALTYSFKASGVEKVTIDASGNIVSVGSITLESGEVKIGIGDTKRGVLNIYGNNAAITSLIQMWNPADLDGAEEYWTQQAVGAYYWLGPASDPDKFIFRNDGRFEAGGAINAVGGYVDNGTSGIDLGPVDPNTLSSVTFSGGILTAAS